MPRGRKEEEKGKTSVFLDETTVQQKLSHGSACNTLPPGIGGETEKGHERRTTQTWFLTDGQLPQKGLLVASGEKNRL